MNCRHGALNYRRKKNPHSENLAAFWINDPIHVQLQLVQILDAGGVRHVKGETKEIYGNKTKYRNGSSKCPWY
jgi:hypothetical protein